jgi:hypothetical protein
MRRLFLNSFISASSFFSAGGASSGGFCSNSSWHLFNSILLKVYCKHVSNEDHRAGFAGSKMNLRLAIFVGIEGGAIFVEHFAQFGVHCAEAGLFEGLGEDDIDNTPQDFHGFRL